MISLSRRLRRLLAGLPLLGLAAADPASAGLPMHLAPGPAPVSSLADTGPMPHAAAGLARAYGGSKIDVLTYHYDNNRTGWNPTETDLTAASVGSANFGLLTTLAVDGNVFAQPLLVSNYVMPDGSTHDVLIVATGHDSVYAYDAGSYALLWQVSLGTPQPTADVDCYDARPEYGISSTPVILRHGANAATLYVVAATEPSKGRFLTELHALDLGTGADIKPPALIAPTGKFANGAQIAFDPRNEWNRAGLASDGTSIYIGIGSHCDNNEDAISGWLLRYSASLNLLHAFHTIETPQAGGAELASIWMTGFAPAIDGAGNVFVVTGNGAFARGQKDWGESVLKLPPDIKAVTDKFTDDNYADLSRGDTDFGSGGVMLVPPVSGQAAPPMAVAMGKSSVLYLLNQTNLGGLKPNNAGALQSQKVSNEGLWGGPAFFAGPNGPIVYAQTHNDVLRAYSLATGAAPTLTRVAAGTTNAGYGGSLPIVSSSGAAAGTGVVWLIRRSAPIALEAYDASALGAPIFAANAGVWSNTANQNAFVTPMQANGRVYAPAYKTVKVFGLAP